MRSDDIVSSDAPGLAPATAAGDLTAQLSAPVVGGVIDPTHGLGGAPVSPRGHSTW